MIRDKSFIYGVLAGLMLAFIGYGLLIQTTSGHASSFAYVDMDRVTNGVSENILSKNLSTEESEKQIKGLREQLDILVDEYSKRQDKILYSHPRPLQGAKDVTDELLKELFKKIERNAYKDNK